MKINLKECNNCLEGITSLKCSQSYSLFQSLLHTWSARSRIGLPITWKEMDLVEGAQKRDSTLT